MSSTPVVTDDTPAAPKGTAGHVALALIQSHLKECAEARKETNIALRRLHSRMDWILRTAVTALLGLAAWGGNRLYEEVTKNREPPQIIYQQPAPIPPGRIPVTP